MENNASIGMAKASQSHQIVIKDLIYHLTDDLDSDFLVIPEPNYDDGDAQSKQPDVLIVDIESEEMKVSIEVCLIGMVKSEIKKCQQALADYPQLEECFVIAYKSKGTFGYNSVSYTKVTREEISDTSISDILDIDFQQCLH